MALLPGYEFDTKGFEYVASIDTCGGSGRVLVLHNNSSHYHVAYVANTNLSNAIDDGAGPEMGEKAVLVESIHYGRADENELMMLYAVALTRAMQEALTRR